MSGLNRVILVGNLGADVDLRFTTSGKAVADLRVATSRRFTDSQGVSKEETQWHRVVVWGKQAENCKKFLSKGKKVAIEGRLQHRQFEKDGQKRYISEVVAEEVQFLSPMGQPAPTEE